MSARGGPAPSWFPLRRQLLDSSVWEENPTVCKLWVTLLLVASEPGRRGNADMTVRALAGRACLSPEETRAALDVLLAPDQRSRSRAAEGRRIEPIDPDRDWGWRLVNWDQYLPGIVQRLSPISGHTLMMIVGVIEIIAGIGVALRPRIFSHVVAAWLVVIILNLLMIPGYFDVVLRDFGLFLAALALGRLSQQFANR